MGRPKASSLRDMQLKLNLTATEYECIVRRAKAVGMRPTHYSRAVVLSYDAAHAIDRQAPSNADRLRSTHHDFAFHGLLNCGHCGCALVGELKKGRYVYDHCTGYKGKCGEPYVREEVIAKKLTGVLGQIHFGDDVLSWITKALRESHADEQKKHEAAIARLRDEYDRLQRRMHAIYVDKLDGRIDNSFYGQMSEQWKLEQDKLAKEIARHETADRTYLDEGAGLIELAHDAQRLFAKQDPREQRRLLNFLLSNSTWKNGDLTPTFRQPFDLIAEAAANAKAETGGGALNSPEHPVWLGN